MVVAMKSHERRKILIDRMEELARQGQDCQNCAGTCCTFEANSMMVTPLEAWEIFEFLKSSDLLDQNLKEKIFKTIKEFRLDQSTGNGKRSFIRRTYTCPFFHHRELGCALPKEVKPYGCLAFNAHHETIKAKEFCYSEKKLLMERDELFSKQEEMENERVKNQYKIYWDKLPLPVALVDFFNADDQQSN
jgi:hypothetical protein